MGVIAWIVLGLIAGRRLQQRFGPEYGRVVGEQDSKRKAEAELTERKLRVRDLDIQPAGTASGPAAATAYTSGQLTEPSAEEMAK
jgi:hypothetical protein